MILARVRKQQDCHRELTSEELQAWEEDETKARRNHVPPSLRDKPSNDQVGTLHKEGYVIEASHDGGHQWSVYFAVKTVDFGEPVKIDNDQVEGVSRAREHRLETLKKIGEALDRQAVEKQQQG
ncbi:hypothetical protein A3J19_04870 [Candidatus Daviesbacteria bacterium RIFCSPLOWO2_02_FULL_41_8]|uniref:Uncharacterized protein n=3 Tax=Candidatus Daviesiibacteriota TaxID=1752718 RepID=A0A1F5NHQ2_9BACT|nr:MAG: hypothetical protein A2871_02605 [Candidatus Daviesbacteria bacterium RIFCSPHIGHO2_01_FULL_41_23]OGE33800.1 MAG: hypothetical protein A3D83_04480 [Candidatus Daviesbacteria bacterium RIFCSPHIGHO2_02_FULL_41_10]OGE62067.1 MAG: hypothetical protein A2967_00220 [Candidatus Daviesbacteria bacterium RIFCSPLOWO2_01_FULL_41_32]OGE77032.1 MAG: hypothetical protein A3J19_04870 [Candidatus Daviesbacteria bacterium RIFCSPLOWO2_02_FULL_41_8]